MSALPVYVQALLSAGALPAEYTVPLDALARTDASTAAALDGALAFALGAPCPPDAAPDTLAQWTDRQRTFASTVAAISAPANGKRARSDGADASESSKRPRLDDQPNGAPAASSTASPAPAIPPPEDDPPLFTLPGVSATSPVRKKVLVVVHKHTLRLVHPTTNATEASIPLSALRRAFLLPTRGKPKPHWTVVLLPSDAPDLPAKGKAKSAAAAATASPPAVPHPQIIFGLDALAPTPLSTTAHATGTTPADAPAAAKNGATLPLLRALLALLPTPLLEPSPSSFRSGVPPSTALSAAAAATLADARQGDAPRAGVDAYRGAKPGTLWFFARGVLWGESRPCEFWDAPDLVRAPEGVRVVSATGRTCAVWVRRRVARAPPAGGSGGDGAAGGGGDGEEEEAEETEFGMIDGREQEPLRAWVRRLEPAFGRSPGAVHAPAENGAEAGAARSRAERAGMREAGPLTANTAEWAGEDEEDGDFVGSSDDGASGSGSGSGSESDDDGGGGGDEGSGAEEDAEGTDEDQDGEGEEDEEGELDPARHPLMRPGAMPKRVSRAAMDMVVGMVVDDVLGGGRRSAARSDGESEAEVEEDELDD